MSANTLGTLIRSYFEDYLTCQKGLSGATRKSYRDTLRLFLLFVAGDCRRRLSRLSLAELSAVRVARFLDSLERERHNHIRTRNQRLSSLRAFFEYMALRVPEMLAEAERVAAIPAKRVAPPATGYLEAEQIEALFAGLPQQGPFALRDRALLLFLYNTGARVQEVAELTAANLEFDDPPRVHLHGKGDKWRVCPLWPVTARLLLALLTKDSSGNKAAHQAVFVSRQGRALTRFGIYKVVRRHTRHLTTTASADPRPHPVSPHSLRHSTAVHLLEAGVEVNVIRAWLGHVSLETTNRYAELTLRSKAQALEQCEPPSQSSEGSRGLVAWRKDDELLTWLESL